MLPLYRSPDDRASLIGWPLKGKHLWYPTTRPRPRTAVRQSLMFRSIWKISFILGILLVAGCISFSKKSPSLDHRASLHGMASWYGPSFHGKPTANGELYDMWALTAAHRTLPFNTWVQVQKVTTGKTVTVRINDRGPFIKGRIIDLSYAGARELEMIGEGTAEVILTIVNPTQQSATFRTTGSPPNFWVQAGSFRTLREAMLLRERLAKQFPNVRVHTVKLKDSGERHRVQIGSLQSQSTAQETANQLKKDYGLDAWLFRSK